MMGHTNKQRLLLYNLYRSRFIKLNSADGEQYPAGHQYPEGQAWSSVEASQPVVGQAWSGVEASYGGRGGRGRGRGRGGFRGGRGRANGAQLWSNSGAQGGPPKGAWSNGANDVTSRLQALAEHSAPGSISYVKGLFSINFMSLIRNFRFCFPYPLPIASFKNIIFYIISVWFHSSKPIL